MTAVRKTAVNKASDFLVTPVHSSISYEVYQSLYYLYYKKYTAFINDGWYIGYFFRFPPGVSSFGGSSSSKGGHGGEQNHLQLPDLPLLAQACAGTSSFSLPACSALNSLLNCVLSVLPLFYFSLQVVNHLKPIIAAAAHLLGMKDVDNGEKVFIWLIYFCFILQIMIIFIFTYIYSF